MTDPPLTDRDPRQGRLGRENTYHLGTVEDHMRSVVAAKLATGFELLHHAATKDVASNLSKSQSNEPCLLNAIFEQQLSSPQ